MKFTVDITKEQCEGIKKYLASLGDNDKPTRKDVQQELQGIVDTHLQCDSEAVFHFIYNTE